jgi:phosphohistidine swiveling domain-containing protein
MIGSQVVKANYSLIGAVTGKCKVIWNFEDLVEGKVKIEEEDILVTAKTSNYWNQYLTTLRGIVTVDGSPTAHPMLIGRERNLVVLCGIPDLMERCRYLDGKTITIDGLTKWLYNGSIKLNNATMEELEGQFVKQKIVKPKNDDESIKFLRDYGRLIEEGGNLYTRNPNTALSPIWRQLYKSIYAARFPLVNSCRNNKFQKDVLSNVCKDIGKYNVDLLVPTNRTLSIFEGMSLEECERYHKKVDDSSHEYIQACMAFFEIPCIENWNIYQEKYAPIYASLWLSFFWRMYLKQFSTTIANSLGVTNFHYNEILRQTQEELSNL